MDNPETLATLGTQTQDKAKQINVRENRRGNQEWTIQRHWQHWINKTQGEGKHSETQNTTSVGHSYAQANTNNVNKKMSSPL